MTPGEPFAGFPLEEAIASRARRCGIELRPEAVAALAAHARAVIAANEQLHLTAIVEPAEFVERHVGESLEGAAELPPGIEGRLLDLGSGNGYPGLPLLAARPGLEVVLAEASVRKAEFLRGVSRRAGLAGARVLARQVQRASDLEDVAPLCGIATRAAGGWAKVLPRLAPALSADGVLLVWAGEEVESVRSRVAWRRYELERSRPLPDRERSWVWVFHRRLAGGDGVPGAR